LAVILSLTNWPARHVPVRAHGTSSAAISTGPALALKLPDGRQLREWTEQLDAPLQREMKSVVHDTRTAMNALAVNFLPETFRASWLSQAQN
jgi:hypothetical protein